jgi:hypothetical protein
MTGRHISQAARSCEKINNLICRLTDQGAKTRKEQLLCFLCAFRDFARQPTDEMLLLIQELFHSFASVEPHDDSACLTSEGRIVGVCPRRFGDATGWCKEQETLPILNLPLTSTRLFHKVFNKPVEK